MQDMTDFETSHYRSDGPSGSSTYSNQRNEYHDRNDYNDRNDCNNRNDYMDRNNYDSHDQNMSRYVQNQGNSRPLLPMPSVSLPKPIPARRDDRSPSPMHYSSQ